MKKYIEFDKEELFKELFPELYNLIYSKVDWLLGGDKEKIKERFDNIRIKFFAPKLSMQGFFYDWNNNIVEFYLYNFVLDKVKTKDDKINWLKLKHIIMNDFGLRDGLIHEVLHSVQGLYQTHKIEDYKKQILIDKKQYDDITYEQEVIIEALIIAKKLGTKFEDLDKSLQYHLWNSFKYKYGILKLFR